MPPWGRKNRPKAGSVPPEASVEVEVDLEEEEEEDTAVVGPAGRPQRPTTRAAATAVALPEMSHIGQGMEVHGGISTGSPLTIEGGVYGDVHCALGVEVRSGAVVQGNITAKNVGVSGSVKGRISASERLEIAATGRVEGDVEVRTLQVESGGILMGRCDMRVAGTQTPMS